MKTAKHAGSAEHSSNSPNQFTKYGNPNQATEKKANLQNVSLLSSGATSGEEGRCGIIRTGFTKLKQGQVGSPTLDLKAKDTNKF